MATMNQPPESVLNSDDETLFRYLVDQMRMSPFLAREYINIARGRPVEGEGKPRRTTDETPMPEDE